MHKNCACFGYIHLNSTQFSVNFIYKIQRNTWWISFYPMQCLTSLTKTSLNGNDYSGFEVLQRDFCKAYYVVRFVLTLLLACLSQYLPKILQENITFSNWLTYKHQTLSLSLNLYNYTNYTNSLRLISKFGKSFLKTEIIKNEIEFLPSFDIIRNISTCFFPLNPLLKCMKQAYGFLSRKQLYTHSPKLEYAERVNIWKNLLAWFTQISKGVLSVPLEWT